MDSSYPAVRTVTLKVITDKPVKKTPYQVKGVFMRQYPEEELIPMLDGRYRDQYRPELQQRGHEGRRAPLPGQDHTEISRDAVGGAC